MLLDDVKIQVSVLVANDKIPECAEFSKFILCITFFLPIRNTKASNYNN